MTEINKKLQVLNRKKADKLEKKRGMDERLLKLRQHQSSNGMAPKDEGPIHRITVTVSSKEIVAGKMSISYLVANAGWVPMYDLRSDGLTSKINLTYKAQVFQNSGLDWDNIKIKRNQLYILGILIIILIEMMAITTIHHNLPLRKKWIQKAMLILILLLLKMNYL
jgi:hypothetical protein